MSGGRLARVLSVAIATACAAGEPGPLAETEQAIIGGTVDYGDPAVVSISMYIPGGGWGRCSGSVIAPRVILTAAHCVQDVLDAGFPDAGRFIVVFGWNADSPVAQIDVVEAHAHRQYDPVHYVNDIAVLRLAEPTPEAPLPLFEGNLGALVQTGDTMRTVGFGMNDAQDRTGVGTKRQANLGIVTIARKHLIIGKEGLSACFGDSGGPTFYELDGVERQVGVSSTVLSSACDRSTMTRVDYFVDRYLRPALSYWDGPCAADGACVLDGDCAIPDPDCGECGPNGVCGVDCELPDWDCPVGAAMTAACEDRYDCESRFCLEASEDPRVRYCSEACDPAMGTDCGSGLLCADRDGTYVCQYEGTTPRVQGAPCSSGGGCRSGLCHPDGYCVEECEPSGPACLEGFVCAASSLAPYVCARSGPDDGWCAVAAARPARDGAASGAAVALGTLALAVLRGARRRRSRAR